MSDLEANEQWAPTVAIVGTGIMGRGIAQVFATAGLRVTVCDRSLALAESARAQIAACLRGLVELGHPDITDDQAVLEQIAVGDLQSAIADAGLIIEAVPENMAIKESVWSEISRLAPADSVLASNTSSFDINTLAAFTGDPSRVLGIHWYNPAYLIPCVELVPGEATLPAIGARVTALLKRVGKSPVTVANSAGFVGNRIQFAMIAEAFRCLEDGIASASDIDLVVRSSFGLRLAGFGPFQLADLGGLDTYLAILRYLTDKLGERFSPPSALMELVEQGRYGAKSLSGVFEYQPADVASLARERDRVLLSGLAALR